MKMLDKTEQSDRAPNPNEKPESCRGQPAMAAMNKSLALMCKFPGVV